MQNIYIIIFMILMILMFGTFCVIVNKYNKKKLKEISALSNSQRRYGAIIEIADAGIIIKDKDGIVLEWNVGAENILGYKPEEMIGQSTKCYTPAKGHAEIDEVENRLKKGEHIAHVEVERKHKEGCRVICSASYTPIFDDNKCFIGSVSIFHDISDKKQMEDALRDAVVAAEEASNAKSSFLANMSHEIRTPMNGVIGYAELAMDDDDIPDKAKDYFYKIKVSADGLLGIINDILDLSKIEAGKIELENMPFSLQSILKQCEAISNIRAEEKGIQLFFYAEIDKSLKLIGDPTKLRQILLNLLSNAIKFTNKGSVTLMAVIKSTENDKVSIHFEVKDSGIGMSHEQLIKIFEPFMQADSSTTRKYGGTGLGLSITKNMIELMGGELKVESVQDVGSKFYFTLEFETVQDTDKPSDTPEEIEAKILKPTFSGEALVCEDNAINRQVIKEYLSRVGLNATVVENGKAGVEAVRTRMTFGKPFDIIFMDIHMPVMDGTEASKKLMKIGNKTPIVALTANAMIKDKEVYLANGMSDYLTKPFTAHALWECLMKFLEPIELVDVSIKSSIRHDPYYSTLNRRLGIEQVAGNEELYEHLLLDFVNDNKTTLSKFKEAVASGKTESAIRMAHTLKGVAGLLGATELKEATKSIEESLSIDKILVTDKQVKAFETAFNAVLAELAPLTTRMYDSVNRVSDNDDPEKAAAIIKKLEPLLESGDSKCIKLLPEINKSLASLGNKGEILIEQIENYDFELAFETLQLIKSVLKQ